MMCIIESAFVLCRKCSNETVFQQHKQRQHNTQKYQSLGQLMLMKHKMLMKPVHDELRQLGHHLLPKPANVADKVVDEKIPLTKQDTGPAKNSTLRDNLPITCTVNTSSNDGGSCDSDLFKMAHLCNRSFVSEVNEKYNELEKSPDEDCCKIENYDNKETQHATGLNKTQHTNDENITPADSSGDIKAIYDSIVRNIMDSLAHCNKMKSSDRYDVTTDCQPIDDEICLPRDTNHIEPFVTQQSSSKKIQDSVVEISPGLCNNQSENENEQYCKRANSDFDRKSPLLDKNQHLDFGDENCIRLSDKSRCKSVCRAPTIRAVSVNQSNKHGGNIKTKTFRLTTKATEGCASDTGLPTPVAQKQNTPFIRPRKVDKAKLVKQSCSVGAIHKSTLTRTRNQSMKPEKSVFQKKIEDTDNSDATFLHRNKYNTSLLVGRFQGAIKTYEDTNTEPSRPTTENSVYGNSNVEYERQSNQSSTVLEKDKEDAATTEEEENYPTQLANGIAAKLKSEYIDQQNFTKVTCIDPKATAIENVDDSHCKNSSDEDNLDAMIQRLEMRTQKTLRHRHSVLSGKTLDVKSKVSQMTFHEKNREFPDNQNSKQIQMTYASCSLEKENKSQNNVKSQNLYEDQTHNHANFSSTDSRRIWNKNSTANMKNVNLLADYDGECSVQMGPHNVWPCVENKKSMLNDKGIIIHRGNIKNNESNCLTVNTLQGTNNSIRGRQTISSTKTTNINNCTESNQPSFNNSNITESTRVLENLPNTIRKTGSSQIYHDDSLETIQQPDSIDQDYNFETKPETQTHESTEIFKSHDHKNTTNMKNKNDKSNRKTSTDCHTQSLQFRATLELFEKAAKGKQ